MKDLITNILEKSSVVPGISMKKASNSTELLLHLPDGNGRMIFYPLFPGIQIAFISIHSKVWPESEDNSNLHPLLFNYCISGRCELLLDNNAYIYIKENEFSLSTQAAQKQYIYPTRHYEGIKLYFDTEILSKESLLQIGFDLDMDQLLHSFCLPLTTFIGDADSELESLLKKLWHLYKSPSIFYMRLYTLELLHILMKNHDRINRKSNTFLTAVQVEIAKKAEKILTADLGKHYPIRCLTEQFSASETSIKNYFRQVYGQNISSYLREIRMNTAAKLLAETQLPVSDISEQIGYANQGKFAAVFKNHFRLSPLEYRRKQKLDSI